MLIRKNPPRPHALGEPLLHQNHPLPVTRRDFIAAGFLSGPAMVIGPAWLGGLPKARGASAALSPGIPALLCPGQSNVPTAPRVPPFIWLDLPRGAHPLG